MLLYYYIIILLYYYIIILLYYYIIILLYYCIILLWYYDIMILWYYYISILLYYYMLMKIFCIHYVYISSYYIYCMHIRIWKVLKVGWGRVWERTLFPLPTKKWTAAVSQTRTHATSKRQPWIGHLQPWYIGTPADRYRCPYQSWPPLPLSIMAVGAPIHHGCAPIHGCRSLSIMSAVPLSTMPHHGCGHDR
jgi:hypothetical protein